MTTELVFSPINDEKINSHINESEIWKKAYFPDEVTDDVRLKYNKWYAYSIRFDGLIPIHCVKVKEL